jgi:hypothetical protein
LTEGFCGILQSLQANTGVVLYHDCSIPNSFPIICHNNLFYH